MGESDPLPDRCCGRCAHGREQTDPGTLTTKIICRGGPPTAILIQIRQRDGSVSMGVQAHFPPMGRDDPGCGFFDPKTMES